MNVRDPLNIHRIGHIPALSILRAAANTATAATQAAAADIHEKAVEVGTKAIEKGRQAVEELGQAVEEIGDNMAFSIPRNVPSFDNPQRRAEDRVWVASGMTSRSATSRGGALGGYGFLGSSRDELPLYKDKPAAYAPGHQRGMMRRKRTMFFLIAFVIGVLYYTGFFEEHQEKAVGKLGQWGMLGQEAKARGKVDWLGRRDQVVEAMELSWDAYEKHAWGTFLDSTYSLCFLLTDSRI